jgi:hypothetical protein
MLLSTCANLVLQEFGGVMPDSLVSFEDAAREFLSVRALELQKLGVSTTDITVSKRTIYPTERDALLTVTDGIAAIPAFVELTLRDDTSDRRSKVEIVPTEAIPGYEGSRAIAFYGTPQRYRLSFDAWDEDGITLWYDPVEDITAVTLATDLTFPANFWTYVVKKAAINIVRVGILKLAVLDPAHYKANKKDIAAALQAFASLLAPQVVEWEMEFKKFRNLDLNSQAHLRRTQDEIMAGDFDNVTGNIPLDFIG